MRVDRHGALTADGLGEGRVVGVPAPALTRDRIAGLAALQTTPALGGLDAPLVALGGGERPAISASS